MKKSKKAHYEKVPGEGMITDSCHRRNGERGNEISGAAAVRI
jgi:hypothetical protein